VTPCRSGHSGEIAAARAFPFRELATAATAPLLLLAPRPLEAQFYFWQCRHEWIEYLGAAAVAKLAIIAAFGNPNPLTVEAAALAVGLYLSLGEQLVDCIAEHS
jgi:hypothetical protein